MKKTRSEIVAGLGLFIILLSVISAVASALAAEEAATGSVCVPAVSSINRADQADKDRGQTSNEYGTLSLHSRAGMTTSETGDVKSDESKAGVFCKQDLEKGQPSNEGSTMVPSNEGV